MAQTLGEQLIDIQTNLEAARKSTAYKMGDRELQRSYSLLLQEKESILNKIDTYGSNYIEGQSSTPKKAFSHVSFK